ncbi:MAG: response regulator [Lachnospiraceae bacterium]|nr:response regulator [Lachnospiraceae bacterium]
MLKYNIDFEIMGLLIMIVVGYHFHVNYAVRTRSDKAFAKLVWLIIGAQLLDMITAITFSFQDPKLNTINMIMTIGYYLCAFATAVAFERYVTTYVFAEKQPRTLFNTLGKGISIAYAIHCLINPITHWAFYFEPDGTYVHGPLYILGYILPAMYAMEALYYIIRYHKRFAKKQWISSVAFVGVVFGAMILQLLVLTDVYLTFGLVPVALLMILFSLETPDYRKLMKTMDELEQARQVAMQANRVKSDFLANMSHEIRTPINAILGFDEMILRESKEEAIRSYGMNIKSSGHTLLSLVNDILDLSKIEAGKMEIVNAEYDVACMLSDLLKMISPRAADKGLKLSWEIDEAIPSRLLGDEVRVAQVLTNLMTNAVKYTLRGEVTLRVKLQKTEGDQATLLFEVQDTGMGIKEEDRDKLFSEFGRIEDAKNHKIEGTGLGLPISQKCLRLMGSELLFESVYRVGSRFHFELTQGIADATPIGDFDRAREGAIVNEAVFHEDFIAPDARILAVDDVEMNLKVFRGLLKASKIMIDVAGSGEVAIEKIKKRHYDCIFMDHQMPVMDGIETLQKLQKESPESIKDTPVIALTANAIAGAREQYLQKGFADYLAKPINGWELSALLHKWLPQEKLLPVPEREEEIMEFFPDEESAQIAQADAIFENLKQFGFDVEAGLGFAMQDQSLYFELLKDFAQERATIAKELEDSYSFKDWKNYRIKAHALKSAAKTIGAMALSEAARELEQAAADLNEDLIKSNHEGFLEEYEETSVRIREAFR